jgi:hypothetical protein
MRARRREIEADSSSLRDGASPNQNGIVGGSPRASSTRTTPLPIPKMRQEVFPSWKMSPCMLSIAKSSFKLPTYVPSGSRSTR